MNTNKHKDFAVFKSPFKYQLIKEDNQNGVDNKTIAFITDDGTIRTHGATFGGRTQYVAGHGISIQGDTLSVDESQLEGNSLFKLSEHTNFNETGNNYKVRLSTGNLLYVTVPVDINPKPTVTPDYTEIAFYSSTTENQPNPPAANALIYDIAQADVWCKYAYDNGRNIKSIWMSTRMYDGTQGVFGPWGMPVQISGSDGNSGADGKNGINGDYNEYIYALSNSETQSPSLNTSAIQQDDYIPSGWRDNPQGVSLNNKYEWMAWRRKTYTQSNSSGTWSRFYGPILWSAYGKQGTDGDGVEYIYYANAEGRLPEGDLYHPERWDAVNEQEYRGPEGTPWTDDPTDIDSLGEGAKQWVSVRRKYADNGGTVESENAYWHKFSAPALWAYYSFNGIVDGYTVSLTNSTMPVGVNAQGTASNYSNTTNVEVFHNGVRYTDYSLQLGNPVRSDGQAVTTANVRGELTNNGKSINVIVTELTNFNGVTATIPVMVVLGDGTARELNINVIGIVIGKNGENGQNGENGYSLDMGVSAAAVRVNYDRTVSTPTTIDVIGKLFEGGETNSYTLILPNSQEAQEWGITFTYQYSSGDTNQQEITLSNTRLTISRNDLLYDKVTFRMYYNDLADSMLVNPNYKGICIDVQDVPFVRDGAPGIGVSPVSYQINVLSNNIICYKYDSVHDVYSGNVTFTITKIDEHGNRSLITKSPNTDGDNEVVIVNISNQTSVQSAPLPGETIWNAIVDETNNEFFDTPYTFIAVKSVTGTILSSVVIPFIMKGEDGAKGDKGDPGTTIVQGLSGTIMRLSNYAPNTPYYDGTTPDSNGITYMDVVLYEGDYYRPKSGVDPNQLGAPAANGAVSSNWILFTFMGDAAFLSFIAKYGFIENLTARELVITDNNNNPVAGMTRGTAVSGDGDAINNITRGNVRIWAGNPISSGVGNLMNCPFYVTDTGELHANNAYITGNVTGSTITGSTITTGSKFSVNSDGLLTASEATISGNITATQGVFDNCIINDTCTVKGVALTSAIVKNASENNSENNVYLDDTLPSGSIVNVIVLGAYVAHPIKVYSRNKQMRAYFDGSWSYMNDSATGYSCADIQKPGVFTFTIYDNVWYVMLDYAD